VFSRGKSLSSAMIWAIPLFSIRQLRIGRVAALHDEHAFFAVVVEVAVFHPRGAGGDFHENAALVALGLNVEKVHVVAVAVGPHAGAGVVEGLVAPDGHVLGAPAQLVAGHVPAVLAAVAEHPPVVVGSFQVFPHAEGRVGRRTAVAAVVVGRYPPQRHVDVAGQVVAGPVVPPELKVFEEGVPMACSSRQLKNACFWRMNGVSPSLRSVLLAKCSTTRLRTTTLLFGPEAGSPGRHFDFGRGRVGAGGELHEQLAQPGAEGLVGHAERAVFEHARAQVALVAPGAAAFTGRSVPGVVPVFQHHLFEQCAVHEDHFLAVPEQLAGSVGAPVAVVEIPVFVPGNRVHAAALVGPGAQGHFVGAGEDHRPFFPAFDHQEIRVGARVEVAFPVGAGVEHDLGGRAGQQVAVCPGEGGLERPERVAGGVVAGGGIHVKGGLHEGLVHGCPAEPAFVLGLRRPGGGSQQQQDEQQ
jgi:hypothetical protein